MYTFIFSKKAEKSFKKQNLLFQKRLIQKLKNLKDVDNIFVYLSKLENMLPATHRLRIWDIRVILEQDKGNPNTFIILKCWKRWDIYK